MFANVSHHRFALEVLVCSVLALTIHVQAKAFKADISKWKMQNAYWTVRLQVRQGKPCSVVVNVAHQSLSQGGMFLGASSFNADVR